MPPAGSAPRIRANYEELKAISQRFATSADNTQRLIGDLRRHIDQLQGGDWKGRGANAFYDEMTGSLLPALQRLAGTLTLASQITAQVSQRMQTAERDAAAVLNKPPGPASPTSGDSGGGILSAIGGALSTAAGFVGDLFVGAGHELWDMGAGLVSLVTNPIGILKGLGQAVMHPGQLLDALVKPFVEDWKSGHPGRAIGRGIIFVGSFFIGAGEAKAAASAGKAGEAMSAAAKIAEAAEAAKAAEVAAKAAELAKATEAARAAAAAEAAAQAARVAEAAEAARLAEAAKGAEAAKAAEGADAAKTAAKYGDKGQFTRDEWIKELAQDPAHKGVLDAKGIREAEVGLSLEESGKIPKIAGRDPSGAAEFIDVTGQKWDVKAFNSKFPPKKGGFQLERDLGRVESEIGKGENVILDSANLTADHAAQLKAAIEAKGLSGNVIWFP